MPILLQFSVNNEPSIELYEVWKEPVAKTLDLVDAMTEHVLIGFNLVFDVFQLVKLRSIWNLLPGDWIPEEHINDIALIEPQGQEGFCWKPYSALDLLLHSRKGPYQSLMARKPIRIKRVPLAPVEWKGQVIPMAYAVANYLEENVEFEGIHFARTGNPDAPKWSVLDIKNDDGVIDRDFADIVLQFHPDGSLKSLAEHALKMTPKYVHSDIEIDPELRPYELGYAPYALAVSSLEENWEVKVPADNKQGYTIKYAWPGVIHHHINHWHTNTEAREYANDDITYTRELYKYFGEPEHGDVDSVLACMVPAIRWRGFELDIEGIKELRQQAQEIVERSPVNPNKPSEIREYICEKCDTTEREFLAETTKKAKLKEMAFGADWRIKEEEPCLLCLGEGECKRCDGQGFLPVGPHPASIRAKEVLDIKVANKERELYDKLLISKKLHASFKIIGTLSSRMAGADGLNAQGIKNEPRVREKFPLAWYGMVVCGGDFNAFEVTIADAVYNDPDLRQKILKGKKLHGLFGTCVYPKYTYEQILDSEKNPDKYDEGDMYKPSKSAVFAKLYGGNAFTLKDRLGVEYEVAVEADERWAKMFPGIGESQKRVTNLFQPLHQPEGPGTPIYWREPQEYVESFLGFRRYFTLEYKIIRALFNLAQDLPSEWKKCKVPVTRFQHRGVQTAAGAVSSALYGAAGRVADGIVRAATNHEIQSPGADITKFTQAAVYKLQPYGVHEWVVAPMNVHDELVSVTHPDYVEAQEEIVLETVESFREKVPLINITWSNNLTSWADKKGQMEEPEILEEEEIEEILEEETPFMNKLMYMDIN